MKKSIFGCLVAMMAFGASAANVASQSELESALKDPDKNITVTKSFTTTKDISIPEAIIYVR